MGREQFIKWIEGQGLGMRRYLQLSNHDILDPFALAKEMGVHILAPNEVPTISDEVINHLLNIDPKSWSAGCLRLPTGSAIVMYNPTHAPTRVRATIMEELAHIHLKHKGSTLQKINGSIVIRSYEKSKEKQAYSVGAAALLPMDVLKRARAYRTTRSNLAENRGVSVQLVTYREQVTGLSLMAQ